MTRSSLSQLPKARASPCWSTHGFVSTGDNSFRTRWQLPLPRCAATQPWLTDNSGLSSWVIFSRCWMLNKYICLPRKLRIFYYYYLMGNCKTPNVFASTGCIPFNHPYPSLSNKIQMNCNVRQFLPGPWFPMRKEGEWHFKRAHCDLCFCIHG